MKREIDLSGTYRQNQAALTGQRLINHWGFQAFSTSSYLRPLDDRHGAVVYQSAKDTYPEHDDPVSSGIKLGLARRDINDYQTLWEQRDDDDPYFISPWRATVTEQNPAPDRWFPDLGIKVGKSIRSWWSDVPFEELVVELDASIEALVAWATLENIESQLYRDDKPEYLYRRMINSALSGRRDDVETDLVTMEERLAGAKERAEKRNRPNRWPAERAKRDHMRDAMLAFLDEHPNGIDR